ncbi:MAG: S-adenosyl-l-methionine hydroxide adenosyltransferase family protein, partial [Calditrichia bacterium]
THEACRVYEIAIRKIPWKISPTFHGRDVFAPLAALVAKGENIKKYLHPLKNPLSFVQPLHKIGEGCFRVPIIHIDHFGNIILNFSRRDFMELGRTKNLKVRLKKIVIEGIRETFGKVPKGEILLVWDSSDFLQISLNGGSAAAKLGISLEDEVEILL